MAESGAVMPSLIEALKPLERGVVSLVGAGGKSSLMYKLARELSDAGKSVLTTTTTKIFVPSKAQCEHVVLSDSSMEIIQKANFNLEREETFSRLLIPIIYVPQLRSPTIAMLHAFIVPRSPRGAGGSPPKLCTLLTAARQ